MVWCRDARRGAATATELSAQGPGTAELIVADLEDPDAIRAGVQRVFASFGHLDLLVNNAALYDPRRRVTVDGLERTFAVNVLGGFRLVHHLRPLLQKAPAARIIALSSRSHAEGRIVFDDLLKSKRYRAYRQYADSKLAVMLLTRELGRRLQGSGMVTMCVHPGVVGSEFAQDEPSVLRMLFRFARPWMRTPKKGADTVLWLADHPDPSGFQGAYLADRKLRRPTAQGQDDAVAAELWRRCTELAGDLPPW